MPTKASTTARGYGYDHAKERRRWAKQVKQHGYICTRCGKAAAPGSAFHLDHDDHDRTQYRGVSHPFCNEQAGGLKAKRVPYSEQRRTGAWAKRPCKICGTPFAPRYTEQRCCSRGCGLEWRRRNSPPSQPKRPPAKASGPTECIVCATPITQTPGRGALRLYCSTQCGRDAYAQRKEPSRSRTW